MNHHVPDFEMDEDYSIPTSSCLTRPKKSALAEDVIMELLWQNGPVVVQSQNQRSLKKSQIGEAEQSSSREIRPEEETTPHLFIQEDDMAPWLHSPLDDSSFYRDLYADLLYPAPTGCVSEVCSVEVPSPQPSTAAVAVAVAVGSRPPMPPLRRLEMESPQPAQRYQNFVHFSRPKGRIESGPLSSKKAAGRESTVVESTEAAAGVGPESGVSCVADSAVLVSGGNIGCATMNDSVAAAGTSSVARELATCEPTVTSSPGGSGGASVIASAGPSQKPTTTEDRKRKGRESDDTECHSEYVEFEATDAKKQVRGSTCTKKSRAAEVHNLSERRRRDRINEKMKALQELIPCCNKTDKASMLDEAIEYLKSLQLQVQMMSMGCSMIPMMFPGVQQYMPPMGMGMGMGMGMNRPMVPFPSVLAGSALQTPAAAAHLCPRFLMPAFHVPPVPVPDPSRIQVTNQSDPMPNANQPRIPNFTNAYRQNLGLHQTQVPLPQNQAVMQSATSKPTSRREIRNPENHQSG